MFDHEQFARQQIIMSTLEMFFTSMLNDFFHLKWYPNFANNCYVPIFVAHIYKFLCFVVTANKSYLLCTVYIGTKTK